MSYHDAKAPSARGRQRVLVADRSDTSRLLLSALLDAAGLEVRAVANGSAALSAVSSAPFDLVLMDVDMPELSDLSVAARSGAESSSAMIVAMTNRCIDHDLRGTGVDAVIVRASSAAALTSQIMAHLAEGPKRADTIVWNREPYLELETRLGAARLHGHLVTVAARLAEFDKIIRDDEPTDAIVANKAHDLQGIGGMLGFEELAHACRQIQDAFHSKLGPSRPSGLKQIVARAIEALDQEIDLVTNRSSRTSSKYYGWASRTGKGLLVSAN